MSTASSRGGIEAALEASLETTPVLPRDAVTVQLALRYAEALDDLFSNLTDVDCTEDAAAHARVTLEISRMGARLESVLDRLGMSPGARPAVPRGGQEDGVDPARAALEQLQRDAAAGTPASGVDYAASVDPAVTEADTTD